MAVVFAVASVAFTTGAKTDDFDCTGSLVWYQAVVGNGDDITVSVGSPIDAADLSFLRQTDIQDLNPAGITSADFSAHLRTQAAAQTAYCPTPGTYVCAVGFKPDVTPAGEFKLVNVGGVNYIVPKTTGDLAPRPNVECIIFRAFAF